MNKKKYISFVICIVIIFSGMDCFAMYNKNDESIISEQRGWELEKDKDTIYYADGRAGVQIIDVSNPKSPQKI